MAKTAAWQRKEGKNPKGGLNAKGRASYKRQTGGTLKAPSKKVGNKRRAEMCCLKVYLISFRLLRMKCTANYIV